MSHFILLLVLFKPFLEMDSAYVDYHVRDDRNAKDTVVYLFLGSLGDISSQTFFALEMDF